MVQSLTESVCGLYQQESQSLGEKYTEFLNCLFCNTNKFQTQLQMAITRGQFS